MQADTNLQRQEVDEGFLGQVNLGVKGNNVTFADTMESYLGCELYTKHFISIQTHCTSSQEIPKVSLHLSDDSILAKGQPSSTEQRLVTVQSTYPKHFPVMYTD